ncbi:MAG TPA: SRPBCC family protein [Acidisoma sp.]|uniref:CoxG family protein n=1 Tax=Acidisoma sp. TaxID=1872115 RepID=UPI002B9F94F8|nr:SRPBCC family protein [Acidisoma sp.]HTI00578.1 SRPBCC family protein [Acidisoma sp.]
MKITIEKSLDLPLSPTLAWAMLQDMEGVAACLPGAKITERVDETHYKGTVSVKLGPATVSFKGNIEIADSDPAARTLHIVGTGSETTGTSGASLDLHAAVIAAEGGGSRLSGVSDVTVTGKVATFGARLMNSVSEVLLQKFFANLAARAAAIEAAQPASAPSEAVGAAPVAMPAPAPVEASETKLNALSLIWAVIKDFVASLFRRSKAT